MNVPFTTNGFLSPPVLELVKKYQEDLQKKPKFESSPIHVDEIASKIAYFYERIRKITDWKEENILRRNAIERILKRSLISEISKFNFIFKSNINEIAEPLVLELIRGGHLPNDEIPREKIEEVDKVLKKYIYLIRNAPFNSTNSSFVLKKKVNFFDWLLSIAACEIEETLSFPVKENALIEAMTLLMNERIRFVPTNAISENDKFVQTYIAVHRTLFDLDEAIIAYHLLKHQYPSWSNPSEEFLKKITENIFTVWETIDNILHHHFSKEFFNICEKTDTVFTILSDILGSFKNEPEKIVPILSDKENFKKQVVKYYNQRLTTLKSRLFKLAIFSTLSVFVSNWFSFFVVEVPLAHFFYQGFSLSAAIFDFVVPSIVMFVLVAIIRPPSSSNLNRVLGLSYSFVYSNEEKEIYEIKFKKKRRPITSFIIALFYLIAFLVSFGAVAYFFYLVKIPPTSVILDTIGIALNVFAALVIRNKAREITVEEKTSFGEFFLDIISLPIAETGSWLASKWREYNVVAVFFNVIVETPFISFIEFIESWRGFLKERKADIH